jgi:hypothetical protein
MSEPPSSKAGKAKERGAPRAPGAGTKSVAPCIGPGMVVRRVLSPSHEVVFVKGIIEALEGLAQVFAERGGELTIAAPSDRARELDAVVDDLCAELRLMSLTRVAEEVS